MTKSQTLQAMEKARASHIEQMEKIDLILKGVETKDRTNISKMKCEFHEWIYGDYSSSFANILGAQFYEELKKEYVTWHTEYEKIYALLSQKKKDGFLNKVFSSNKLDILSIEKVKVHYIELEQIMKQFLKTLDKSIRRISALNEEKFL